MVWDVIAIKLASISGCKAINSLFGAQKGRKIPIFGYKAEKYYETTKNIKLEGLYDCVMAWYIILHTEQQT